MRTVTRRRHCNEDALSLAHERLYPYCRKCSRWVGTGGHIHHSPRLGMGGTTRVYTDDQSAPYHISKLCGDCHRAEHGEK